MKNLSFWLKNTLTNLNLLLDSERKIGVQILEILLEIEKRKAYSELHYESLFTFCVKELKFSESQAFQRIQAMHALKNNPELKQKIETGSMSVSTVSQVQVYLRQEKAQGIQRTQEERNALFEQFDHKTSKEVKTEIQELKGERIKLKLFLDLDEEAETLWKAFKAATAHQTLSDDLNAFKLLLKSWLNQKSQQKAKNVTVVQNTNSSSTPQANLQRSDSGSIKVTRSTVSSYKHPTFSTNNHSTVNSSISSEVNSEVSSAANLTDCPNAATSSPANSTATSSQIKPPEIKPRSRYISIKIKKQVFARDQHQCTHCKSKHALTLEHIQPFALGGKHTIDNLKVLCRSCNLAQGIEKFGMKKMKRELRKLHG